MINTILWPILFCCYLDKLNNKSQQNGTGCWIGDHILGSLAYADDLTILSPTAGGLQEQLTICEQYGMGHGMTDKPIKSKCDLFTNRKKAPPSLTLNGIALQWTDNIKHLGNILGQISREDLFHNRQLKIKVKCNLLRKILSKVFYIQWCHYYGCQTGQISQALHDDNKMWNRCQEGFELTNHST